jgi:predicted alpha/beta-fold hydrolase
MEASFLPLELTSVEALQCSLKGFADNMPRVDKKVYLHHGTTSVPIRRKAKTNGVNGITKPDKTLVDLVQEEWRPLEGDFPAHPLMQSGHLQTMYAAVSNFNDVDRVYYARKLLEMNDGGTVGLDVVLETQAQYKKGLKVDEELTHRKDYVKNLPPQIRYMQQAEEAELLSSDDSRPMLIAFHGLSGGSHESYVRAVLHHIIESPTKWAACALNARACGRTAITTPQLFCANWTGIYSPKTAYR